MSNTQVGFNRKQISLIFKIAFLEAMALSIILPSVVSTGEIPSPIPLSFTYIVKAPSSNTYQAFITGTTGLPLFTESNFTKLMNDDIFTSTACTNGCSLTINPGLYNQTQSICPSKNNIYISGTSASDIITQKNTTNTMGIFSGCTGGFRSSFYITGSNFTATGFQVDDTFRDGISGVTGDIFTIPAGVVGTIIQQTILNHASSNAIQSQGSKVLYSQNTISGPIPIPKINGNFGIIFGLATSSGKAFLNTISGFNGSDVSAIAITQGAHNVSIIANTLIQNEFGILVNRAIGVTIQANSITNNYLGGIVIATAIGSIKAGPLTISGNTITNNGFTGEVTFAPCSNQLCGALHIQGNACCWDTVSITGNTFKDTRSIIAQPYDINIPQGTQYTNVTISGNSLGTTSTGKTINLLISLPKSWLVEGNIGWNPQPTTLNTAGATPFTYTNTIADKQQIVIATTGDMSAFSCSISGTSIPLAIILDTTTPVINAADTCTFTYTTTAPTYYVIHQ